MLELVGNDQRGSSCDLSDQNAPADKLEEVCDSQDCAYDAECTDHEAEKGHQRDHLSFRGSHSRNEKEGEDHEGGRICWT